MCWFNAHWYTIDLLFHPFSLKNMTKCASQNWTWSLISRFIATRIWDKIFDSFHFVLNSLKKLLKSLEMFRKVTKKLLILRSRFSLFWRENSKIEKGPNFNFSYFHTLFENYSKCRIWNFECWHFPPIFVLIKLTCL